MRATRSAGLSLLSVVKVRVSVGTLFYPSSGDFFQVLEKFGGFGVQACACAAWCAPAGWRRAGCAVYATLSRPVRRTALRGVSGSCSGAVSHRSSPKPLTAHFVAKSWAREEEADKSTFTRTVSGSGVQVTGLQRTGTWRPFCVCRRGELPGFPVAVLLYAKLGCVWYVARAAEWPSSPRTTEGPVLLAKAQCR